MIPNLANYDNLLAKLEYDLQRYLENNHTYSMLDCLMGINAIPEWILHTDTAPAQLKTIAAQKIEVMKGVGFIFDPANLDADLDTQLGFVRLTCNHSKHKTDSPHIPRIKTIGAATFPMVFPATFTPMMFIGDKQVNAAKIIKAALDFWKVQFERFPII
ncbi:hypothetical protein [Pedobacter sp. Leaf170]|uniref:hypothetical protein n=1 Tax=Pedobacter sp. Leaf170 TaxID=2876558 RepID=UPI001E497CC9|nr:hypothetical protein [Pedobacter sp. Leaf170]